jgi:multidrug efflux pump subunit AcrA (membrane-fusion protein)
MAMKSMVLRFTEAAVVLAGLSLPALVEAQSKSASGIIRVTGGLVTAHDDVEVAAKEAGVLGKLEVVSGQAVKKGELLGKLDDREAVIRHKAAQAELVVAQTQASSDAEIVAAQQAAGAAKKEYEQSLEIRKKNPEAISLTQLRRDELQWLRAEAQIKVAQVEHAVHLKTVDVKAVAVEAGDNEIVKRQFASPVDGVVVEIFKDETEWVPLGERVFRVVRLDRLKVEGFVSAKDVRQKAVIGRPVRVTVELPELADGTKPAPVQVIGKIDYASPVIEANNEFRIRCEIKNVQDSEGDWVISPGSRAEFEIDLRGIAAASNTLSPRASR